MLLLSLWELRDQLIIRIIDRIIFYIFSNIPKVISQNKFELQLRILHFPINEEFEDENFQK